MSRKALLYGAATAALLGLAPATALADQLTFTTAGEHAFTVPSGVSRLEVELTGAHGGSAATATGGGGAIVNGSVAVTPGQTLYAEVGGPGRDGGTKVTDIAVRAGGYNGGGSGATGGGGASDLRTFPASLAGSAATRLVVAGGGGGGGFEPGGSVVNVGGGGGNAGQAGFDPTQGTAAGRPGTDSAGGAGGTGFGLVSLGDPGLLGQGGNAADVAYRGGGGGGGYYGGGAGGGAGPGCSPCWATGGGGGGSSLVPAGGILRATPDRRTPAAVQVWWETPWATLDRGHLDFPDTVAGGLSPAQSITLTNGARDSRLELPDVSVDSDDFVVTSSSCRSVAPGASCVVKVRFAPGADGSKQATMTLSGNTPDIPIALAGRTPAPAPAVLPAPGPAGPAGAQGQPGPQGAAGPAQTTQATQTTQVICHTRRCTVRFADGAPRVTAKGAKVTAKLTRGGVTYATWHGKAKRGPLHLTLKAKRTLKPGRYTLTVTIGGTRITRTATV